MPRLDCEKCGEAIIAIPKNGGVLTRFPDDILKCFLYLSDAPSALSCSRCSHITRFRIPDIAVGRGAKAVLYIPDGLSIDMASVAPLCSIAERLGATAITVARDTRTARRSFLQNFVSPATDLANDYARSPGSKRDWIEQQEAELGEAFFTANWLLTSGAVPVYRTEAGQAPESSLIAHEQAPDEANHVIERHTTQQWMARRAGEILSRLLIAWTLRSMEDRSFDRWRSAAKTLIHPVALSDDRLAAAAEQVGDCVAQIEDGDGAILARYAFDAVLAILCAEKRQPNPRVVPWTETLLLYEYQRRVDGNEGMLLPAELVRETLDEARFWHCAYLLQQAIGQELTEDTESRYTHFIETIERIFPDYVQDFSRLSIGIKGDAPDEAALTTLSSLLPACVERLPDSTALEMVLSGTLREKPHLLPPIIGAMRRALDAADTSADHRLVAWRYAIEMLNLGGFYAYALAAAEVAQTLLESGAGGQMRSHVLNEIGNCHRYCGAFSEALRCYDEALRLWEKPAENRSTRVILTNRAIVLRDTHRYAEAQAIFAKLRPLAHGAERVGIVSSEALCLTRMGEDTQALALLQAHKTLILATLTERRSRQAAVLLARLLRWKGESAEARDLAAWVVEQTRDDEDVVNRASAATVLLDTLAEDSSEAERERHRRRAVEALRAALDGTRGASGLPEVIVGLMLSLDAALTGDGQHQEAERLLRETMNDADPAHSTAAWLLALNAMHHARRRGDERQASEDALGSLSRLVTALWAVSEHGDPIAVLAPNREAVTQLTKIILRTLTGQTPGGDAMLRSTADLHAAPLLTPRLRRRAGLPSSVDDPKEEAARLDALMHETPCVLVQCVSLGDDVAALVTRPGAGSAASPELHLLGIAPEQAVKLGRRLDFALARLAPAVAELSLNSVKGWPDMCRRLTDMAAGLPAGLPLCIVSGPLSSTMLSLALGDRYALCFVPSIGALLAMRAQRRLCPGGLAWRPQSMFAFATWFATERAEAAAALAAVDTTVGTLAQDTALAFSSATGREANAERLLEGLGSADLTYVACHGRILPESESVDLIVADDGRLPPGDLAGIVEDRRAPHVLGWQQLAAVPAASQVVMSSACNSGLAVLHQGGERLGLGRSLFSAGTLTYLAPQWSVPTVAIQAIAPGVLRTWLTSPGQSLAEAVAAQRAAALGQGVSPLAAKAFAVFGDGL